MNKEKQATLQSKILERYASIVDDAKNFGKAINQPLKQSSNETIKKSSNQTIQVQD